MAGIKEHGDVGALRLLAEVEQPFGHLVAREIGAFDHLEADIAQRAGHCLGVDRGIGKGGDVLVGTVADDEGDTAVSLGSRGGKCHADHGNDEGEVAHWKYPCRIETVWQ